MAMRLQGSGKKVGNWLEMVGDWLVLRWLVTRWPTTTLELGTIINGRRGQQSRASCAVLLFADGVGPPRP